MLQRRTASKAAFVPVQLMTTWCRPMADRCPLHWKEQRALLPGCYIAGERDLVQCRPESNHSQRESEMRIPLIAALARTGRAIRQSSTRFS
jgi:hypothetical protein